MNHSAIDDTQEQKTIPEKDMPILERESHMHMLPNHEVLSLEKTPIDRVKGGLVVPTAVALGNMQEAPVSWIVLFNKGFSLISFLNFV
jgi:hypothetical protein